MAVCRSFELNSGLPHKINPSEYIDALLTATSTCNTKLSVACLYFCLEWECYSYKSSGHVQRRLWTRMQGDLSEAKRRSGTCLDRRQV